MSKCTRCHRELKNHTESGMGKICRMKSNRLNGSSDAPKTIIEMVYDNKRGHRNYLIRTGGRKVFVAVHDGSVKCHCADALAGCEHVALIREAESANFPEACAAPVLSVEEIQEHPRCDCRFCGKYSTTGFNHLDCELGAFIKEEEFETPSKGFVYVTERKVIQAVERVAEQEFSCQVTKTGTGRYRVYSFASGSTYTVETTRGIFGVTAHCSCPDFEFHRLRRDEMCKHQASVYHYERQSRIVTLNKFNAPAFAAAA